MIMINHNAKLAENIFDKPDMASTREGFAALYLKRKFPAISGGAAGESRM